jgi:hypothetical protein
MQMVVSTSSTTELSGRVCLITGTSGGMGAAVLPG